MIKFSIICPFYNSEHFLDDTINCVLNQSFSRWELVLINDCSTDKGVIICEKYINKDKRIKLINNQSNCGPYGSRLIGVDVSSGDYLLFLDSDDLLSVHTLSILSNLIDDYLPDIISFKYTRNKDKLQKTILTKVQGAETICDTDSILSNIFIEKQSLSLWNKCYRRSLFTRNKAIRTIRYSEDTSLLFDAAINANKMLVVNIILYLYNDNKNSITHNLTFLDALDCWNTNDLIYAELNKRKQFDNNAKKEGYIKNMYWSLFMCIWLSNKEDKKQLNKTIESSLLFKYLKTCKIPKLNFSYYFILKNYMKRRYVLVNLYKALYFSLRGSKE